MGLPEELKASADAVEELRSSLEEESLSPIEIEGPAARFTVRSEDGTAYPFVAVFLGSSLPCGASLSCSRTVKGLIKANGKLGAHSTLTRAVAAAGRCVGVDLDWVAEAEAEGMRCCCMGAAETASLTDQHCAGAAAAGFYPSSSAALTAHPPTLLHCAESARVTHPPPHGLPAAGNGSDEEMEDAGAHGDSDAGSDGEEDEILREWSKRLVKWVAM